jgi:hypothetical protein
MTEQPAPPSKLHKRTRQVAKKAAHLTAREYLPMGAALAFWAMCALAIGHADTARLLSATVLLRAIMMLVDLSTAGPLRARLFAPADVLNKSRRNAALMQAATLVLAAIVIGVIIYGLERAGLETLALMLPLAAIGLPARAYRGTDPNASSRYFRLIVTSSALVAGAIAWALHGSAASMALAYGLREWIATVAMKLLPHRPAEAPRAADDVLRFAEVARNTVVTSRRLLTYRLTKNILTVFGPFGNFAARTGRGLNWHNRLEPYMPHRKPGFVLFALLTGGAAVALALRSGEPVALIAGAGLLQLCAIAINVLVLWRYLPVRDDPNLVIDDNEDE